MKNFLRACVLFMLAVSNASCGRTLVTDTLKPIDTNTSESVAGKSNPQPYCGQPGLNPGAPGPHGMWVGYMRSYDPGSGLFPCWSWSSAAYRAAFRFDLSKYSGKKILSAVLRITLGQAKYSHGSTASNEGAWAKTLGLATSQWWTKPSPYFAGDTGNLFPYKPIPGMPYLPHGLHPAAQKSFPIKFNGIDFYQVDVSSIVRDWIGGKEPNLGFVMIGTNEKTVKDNGDAALSPVASVRLDVTYSVPKK